MAVVWQPCIPAIKTLNRKGFQRFLLLMPKHEH
jgi:hypothetical protein